jgi:RNase H-fold protein (predicted Holliday junction resolvase)
MTVLGISIGTSRTGVCVLHNDTLLDRHIHDYPTLWSDTKLRIILNRYRQYLHKHKIDAVVVKIPAIHRHTKPLLRLIRRVEALAKEYNCEFDLITKSEIKHTLSLRSTNEIVKFSSMLYPELSALYEKGIATNHSFNKKVYEAVLAAHIYKERQRVRARQIAHTKE